MMGAGWEVKGGPMGAIGGICRGRRGVYGGLIGVRGIYGRIWGSVGVSGGIRMGSVGDL